MPKVKRTVKVHGYGRPDKYPTSAMMKERKRVGNKAKALGLTIEQYKEKYGDVREETDMNDDVSELARVLVKFRGWMHK